MQVCDSSICNYAAKFCCSSCLKRTYCSKECQKYDCLYQNHLNDCSAAHFKKFVGEAIENVYPDLKDIINDENFPKNAQTIFELIGLKLIKVDDNGDCFYDSLARLLNEKKYDQKLNWTISDVRKELALQTLKLLEIVERDPVPSQVPKQTKEQQLDELRKRSDIVLKHKKIWMKNFFKFLLGEKTNQIHNNIDIEKTVQSDIRLLDDEFSIYEKHLNTLKEQTINQLLKKIDKNTKLFSKFKKIEFIVKDLRDRLKESQYVTPYDKPFVEKIKQIVYNTHLTSQKDTSGSKRNLVEDSLILADTARCDFKRWGNDFTVILAQLTFNKIILAFVDAPNYKKTNSTFKLVGTTLVFDQQPRIWPNLNMRALLEREYFYIYNSNQIHFEPLIPTRQFDSKPIRNSIDSVIEVDIDNRLVLLKFYTDQMESMLDMLTVLFEQIDLNMQQTMPDINAFQLERETTLDLEDLKFMEELYKQFQHNLSSYLKFFEDELTIVDRQKDDYALIQVRLSKLIDKYGDLSKKRNISSFIRKIEKLDIENICPQCALLSLKNNFMKTFKQY